jgi:hypothetical protein
MAKAMKPLVMKLAMIAQVMAASQRISLSLRNPARDAVPLAEEAFP